MLRVLFPVGAGSTKVRGVAKMIAGFLIPCWVINDLVCDVSGTMQLKNPSSKSVG